jgi:hypothetical protein
MQRTNILLILLILSKFFSAAPPAPVNFYSVKSQRPISLGHAACGTIQLGRALREIALFSVSARLAKGIERQGETFAQPA